MKSLKYIILIAVVILLASCGNQQRGDYRFVTNAEYFAPKNNLHIVLNARGYIPPNQDATDATLIGKIYNDQLFSDTIFLEIGEGKIQMLKLGKTEKEIANDQDLAETFLAFFKETNYQIVKHKEMKEMFKVIEAVSHGPKATLTMKKLSKLQIINVEFERLKK